MFSLFYSAEFLLDSKTKHHGVASIRFEYAFAMQILFSPPCDFPLLEQEQLEPREGPAAVVTKLEEKKANALRRLKYRLKEEEVRGLPLLHPDCRQVHG